MNRPDKKKQGSWFQRVLAVAVLLMGMGASGCTYVAIGTLGVLGGYVASPDTVEGIVPYSQEELWDASYNIVSIMGDVEEQNEMLGRVITIISGARVDIQIVPVNMTTSKIIISARKTWMPRIKIAQDVYAKIIGSLSD